MRRRFLPAALCAAALLAANCCYIARQGYYVAKYGMAARPVAKVVKDPRTTAQEKEFLGQIARIRQFAFDSIGLTRNKNYTTYVKVDKNYLVDVVAASQPDRFASYTWWFPIVGHVPYKGFFRRTDALAEATRLKKKGLDVTVSPVDGFSTLGFLSDPLYSFWVDFTPYERASLIIHEETHATVYIKSQVAFNEGMADFVGDRGALWFLRSMYGDTSAEYHAALLEREDDAAWEAFLHRLYDALADLYAQPLPREAKLARKQQIIDSCKQDLRLHYSSIFKTNRYTGAERATINNAYLAVRMNYFKDENLFDDLFRKDKGNLAVMVNQLKGLGHLKGESPMEYLRRVSK